MSSVFASVIDSLNLDVVEELELPSTPERALPIPSALRYGPLRLYLIEKYPGSTFRRHQSLSLDALLNGGNCVVATGTASGKSLVFQMFALHRVKQDPDARVIVFYPLKALAADQFERWKAMSRDCGLSPHAIAKVDGDVGPKDRELALARSNIILMTPDVCQAWFMRNVGSSAVRTFLSNLTLLVLDEAHVYESVFGSNVAFLLRRLITAKRHVTRSAGTEIELQILAATATIAEPAKHLEELTGLSFTAVTEGDNGAPQQKRTLIHAAGPDHGAAAEQALQSLILGIIALPDRRRFIAFIDSRQGTERVARAIEAPSVLPYRSGYEAEDRLRIERALRDGSLDGVVSTSALELGIDIPDMEIGINLGVPDSKKSFRQRMGRVGRSRPGLFIVIAGRNSFRQFGQTFDEYFESSVEPSYLYTQNRFIQFAHARCIWDEMEVIKQERLAPPPGVTWPENFETVMKHARPGGARPREFDFMAQLGQDSPHINYPLRQIAEPNFDLKVGRHGEANRIGSIAAHQALREAYPGAHYLHFGKSYYIQQWVASSYERSIRVEPSENYVPTRPILRKTVNVALDAGSLIDARILRNDKGLIAETNLQVNESVQGYTIGSTSRLYRDLRAENPNMSRKQRDIRTTGAVIIIDEPWFAGSIAPAPQNRDAFAKALMGVLGRERSISPRDIDYASTNIALQTERGPQRVSNCVVLYDVVYGGIRLTEDLFDRFTLFLDLIRKAADLAGGDAIVDQELITRIQEWAGSLESGLGNELIDLVTPDGWYQIYRPGSLVSVYLNGQTLSRELIAPKLIDLTGDGTKALFYSYKLPGKLGVIQHDQVQPIGDSWSYILWCPETNEVRELQTDADNTASQDGSNLRWFQVYRPGTSFKAQAFGQFIEREVIEPKIDKDEDGKEILTYCYHEGSGSAYVPHGSVQPTGTDWSLVLWSPESNQYRELSE